MALFARLGLNPRVRLSFAVAGFLLLLVATLLSLSLFRIYSGCSQSGLGPHCNAMGFSIGWTLPGMILLSVAIVLAGYGISANGWAASLGGAPIAVMTGVYEFLHCLGAEAGHIGDQELGVPTAAVYELQVGLGLAMFVVAAVFVGVGGLIGLRLRRGRLGWRAV